MYPPTLSVFFLVQSLNACFNLKIMSGDQVNYSSVNNTTSRNTRNTSNKVDINDLLSRVRDDEKKQKKENLVFFGLIASVIVITGIIASL